MTHAAGSDPNGVELMGGSVAPLITPPHGRRYHGLDFLRASMMSLGVVLHVALNYQEGPADPIWPYRDPNQTGFAGLLVLGVHAFRMPVFFVMAGFFAAMLRDRSGIRGYLSNRLHRIGTPFVIGWVVLFPLVKLGFVFGSMRAAGKDVPSSFAEASGLVAAGPWDNAVPAHLWFLYYLLMYYALSLLAAAIARMAPTRLRARADALTGSIMNGPRRHLRLPILIAVTWLTLLPMSVPTIDTPDTFQPRPSVLACYGVFFAAGWLLYRHRGAIDGLRSWAWLRLGAGVGVLCAHIVLAIAWFIAMFNGTPPDGTVLTVLRVASLGGLSAAAWLVILGGIGVAERLLHHPNRVVRYVVDSSYWFYLAHLPLCVVVPALWRNWDAPAAVKMAAGITVVLALLFVSFEALRIVVARRPAR